MRIFKITFNKCDYDRYCGFVVVAKDEEEVVRYLKSGGGNEEGYGRFSGDIIWEKGYEIKEIRPYNFRKTKVILADYNAG